MTELDSNSASSKMGLKRSDILGETQRFYWGKAKYLRQRFGLTFGFAIGLMNDYYFWPAARRMTTSSANVG